jgi:hypothetical protein
MQNKITLSVAIVSLAFASAQAQFGALGGMGLGMGGPQKSFLSGGTVKLFGDNSAFTANLELKSKTSEGEMSVPGKMAFDGGKSRFEIDMSQMRGGKMPPEAAEHMKSMGMDKTVMISRPDKKVSYMVYPGIQAYVENPIKPQDASIAPADYKVETTELGKEDLDGHPCTITKAVVTDKEGKQQESLMWNATDLKKFPIKIEQTDQGNQTTMLFKNVTLTKPESQQFDAPADFKKYDNMMSMMQQVMMKQLGGMPPGMAPEGAPRKPAPGE